MYAEPKVEDSCYERQGRWVVASRLPRFEQSLGLLQHKFKPHWAHSPGITTQVHFWQSQDVFCSRLRYQGTELPHVIRD